MKTKIASDLRYTVSALLHIHSFQNYEEQAHGDTIDVNGIGFNKFDAQRCTYLAEKILRDRKIADTELVYMQRTVPKYHKQCSNMELIEYEVSVEQRVKTTPAPVSKNVCFKDELMIITFPYNPETIALVKTLSGRRWNSEGKYWTADVCIESIQNLKEWGFNISYDLLEICDRLMAPVQQCVINVSGVKKTLYPFQKEGLDFIEAKGGRVLIGDEMGLGKSIQALAYLEAHPELRPAVIVCPSSLKLNWVREIEQGISSNIETYVISGKNADLSSLPVKDIYIINYDILPSWEEVLRSLKPKMVITDEAHYYKNKKAMRTKAVQSLCKGVPHILALSGTPIVNRPIELFNAINIVSPAVFPSFWKYAMRYCDAKRNHFGWDFNGASRTDELHKKLTKTIMLRRLKKDVLKQLPDKVHTIIPIEVNNRKDYNSAQDDFINWLKGEDAERAERASRAEELAKIEVLKQLAVQGKLPSIIEWIENFIEQGEKLVVFCTHKKIIDALMEEFEKIAVKIDGSCSIKDRQEAVDLFQTCDRIKLFVGNIKAAGVGITLTASSNVAFLELPWTPGDLDQASDRCHRIGQEADSVNVYYLVAQDTIEEEILALLNKKKKVLDAVLDGKDVESDESLIAELISTLKGERK